MYSDDFLTVQYILITTRNSNFPKRMYVQIQERYSMDHVKVGNMTTVLRLSFVITGVSGKNVCCEYF